jgi:hypothetical protein
MLQGSMVKEHTLPSDVLLVKQFVRGSSVKGQIGSIDADFLSVLALLHGWDTNKDLPPLT